MSNDAELRALPENVAEACRLVEYDMDNRQTARGNGFVAQMDEVATIINYVQSLAASERSHVGEWEAMRSALEPFVALADKRDAKFRKRGGDPDAFPDTHPAYDIKAHELPATVWRKARAALANNT